MGSDATAGRKVDLDRFAVLVGTYRACPQRWPENERRVGGLLELPGGRTRRRPRLGGGHHTETEQPDDRDNCP